MIETDRTLAPYEVDDLDGWVLLDLINDNADQTARAERRKLRYAYQLCITNPAVDGDAAAWADGIPALAGYTDTLGGEGTPLVAAFTIEKWAGAAGVSTAAAKRTLATALDLHHRLPRLWARVDELAVPAWKAARVAEDTNRLSLAAATWVDAELERRGTYGLPTLEMVIKSAIAKFHPDQLKNTGCRGRDDWDVTVDHQAGDGNGTSELTAIGDTLDLEKFSSLIADEAATLGRLGDTDTLGQRKAKALGALADRRATADLLGLLNTPSTTGTTGTGPDSTGDPDGSGHPGGTGCTGCAGHPDGTDGTGNPNCTGGTGHPGGELVHPETGQPVTRRRSYLKARLFVHLTLADLAVMADRANAANAADQADADSNADAAFGDSDLVTTTNLFGTIGLDQLKAWLQAIGTDARITPVIDTARQWSVDRHDPPQTMRDQVIARDPHCVFPGCTTTSRRADLDHIDPYDPDGPRGQTNPQNLAPLCRRHHLAKTHGRWTYHRNRDGTYTWRDPHATTWLVTPHGTTMLTTNTSTEIRLGDPTHLPGPPTSDPPPLPKRGKQKPPPPSDDDPPPF